MKQSLQLKVSQSLTLTPQLQQSIRLLQLSTLELQQEIQQALAENPMLEAAEDEESESASNNVSTHADIVGGIFEFGFALVQLQQQAFGCAARANAYRVKAL